MAQAGQGWGARFKAHREKFGTKAAAELLVDRVLARLVNFNIEKLVWLDVDNINPKIQFTEGFDYRFLSATEVAAFAADPDNCIGMDFVGRVDRGLDKCFAAIDEKSGRLAAYGWYALECIEGDHCMGTALSYPRAVAYMYKGFTHPDFRGNRLHGALMAGALRALGEFGIKSLVSTVTWTNRASLRSCERLGYEVIGNNTTFSLGMSFGFYPSEGKKRGVRFGTAAATRAPVRIDIEPTKAPAQKTKAKKQRIKS